MNQERMTFVATWIGEHWTQPMSTDRAAIFAYELADLDFERVMEALHADFAKEKFPPTPMMLRDSVVGGPTASAEELVAELQHAISTVGNPGIDGQGTPPSFSTPVLSDYVRREGGWRAVCYGSREKGAPDYGTYYAQMRNFLGVLIGRHEREEVRAALSHGAAKPEIEMPDLRYNDGDE